jgi:hypothetical protein
MNISCRTRGYGYSLKATESVALIFVVKWSAVIKPGAIVCLLILVAAGLVRGQTPTGAIAGVVRDPSGAAVAGAQVRLTNPATGLTRTAVTSGEGNYSFTVLQAGEYDLILEVDGFHRAVRPATVEAGATTNADFDLVVGEANASMTINGTSPQMRYDSHTVGGTVTQRQIEGLPLNGRSFLELAKLEPGVQPPTRASSNRLFVPALGQPQGNNGRGTRITVDGGSIMAVGVGGSAIGFSQEVVQEFQIATVNFDLTTGLTNGTAINVVTRSGGNELHGTGFYFFRDHTLAAYPALKRDSADPDPFFQRRQFGFAVSGPVLRDRFFFFGNYERNEQRGVAATTLLDMDFAHLSRITPSPFFGNQFSLRLDGRLSERQTGFIRHSHDDLRAFGPTTTQPNSYPSFWTRQPLWADQSILGLTSTLSGALVNDFRFSYLFVSTSQTAATERECPGCLGIGAPSITIAQVGSQVGLSIGKAADQYTLARRYHLNDNLTWQRGAHRTRFGVDWEYNRGGTINLNNEPAALTLHSPALARQAGIPLPSAFRTLEDILQLPLQSVTVGIGDARVPQADGGLVRNWHTLRLFFQDTWRLNSRLTVNYGLGWSIDGNLNYDLSKPALLAPLLGADGLEPTRKQWKNFSPVLGLALTPRRDGKTVLRAGAGYFYDFLFPPYLENERALLGPPGLGRQNISGTRLFNCLPGIPGVSPGAALNFPDTPTRFSGGHLMACLPTIRADLARDLASADQSIQSIQVTKTGSLSPADLPPTTALHVNLGVQREIVRDFVLSADFAYRRFDHVGMGQLDLNRINRARGRVIPQCTTAQQRNDPRALCSNGPINVQANVGRTGYKGLLVRADKRFSHGFQLLGSWAYSSNTGTNIGSGFNLDDWLGNRGPLDRDITHIVNLAGVAQLQGRFQLGFNYSYSSAPPFTAFVSGIDFNGDGTTGDLLPGTTVNAFNRGLGRADLEGLVAEFNLNYAGRRDGKGALIPHLTLPSDYRFDDDFQSFDLRLSREFIFERRWRLNLIVEAFNIFNIANLSSYSGNLVSSESFGKPTGRATQVFGSGGARAFQLAVRVRF